MKKIIIVCLTMIAITINGFSQTQIPSKPTPEKLVNDYADLLTSAEEATLETKLRTIDNRTGIQIAAVTIKTLDGADAADFALQLGRKWGVGHKDNAGIVILISLEDRKWSIQVGYGLEGDLPDITCSDIGNDYLVPNLKKRAFYNAFDQTADKLLDKAGMMSWGERLDQRKVKAELEAKEAARRKQAEEADRIAREKRNQERWDVFMSFIGTAAMIGLPIAIIWFFIALYRDWKKERKRRADLKIFCAEKFIDVHGTMANITSFYNDFIAIGSKNYPGWVLRDFKKEYKKAQNLQKIFTDNLEKLTVYTLHGISNKLHKITKEEYEKLYASVDEAPNEFNMLQQYIHDGIFKEALQEADNKKQAIALYKDVVASCEKVSTSLINEGYNLDGYQSRVDELKQSFNDCVQQEEKLGKDFDNEVNAIVEKIAALEHDLIQLPIIRQEVNENLPKVIKRFPANNDHGVDEAIELLSRKYQDDAFEVAVGKWESLHGDKYVAMKKQCDEVKELNSMHVQSFAQAKVLLTDIESYITQIATQKDTILSLDKALQNAKKNVLEKKAEIDELAEKVKKLASDSDVKKDTEKTANTLLTKIKNFGNAIANKPEPDWIANEEIAISLHQQLEDVKKKMKKEISAAESSRNSYSPTTTITNIGGGGYTGGGSSGGGSSWGGFGGGSFGGGGASGSW